MNVKSALPSRHHHVYEVLHNILKTVYGFVSQNTVLCIAVLAATVSSVFVKPDAEYLSYIDFKTIACLFSTLAVVCALRNIRFFTIIARKIVTTTGNLRVAAIALIYITFIGSMLIANDMALLTFLPLGFIVMQETGKDKYTAYVFILQNIAANLGGMLTPFGNPQNLYLYSKFNIPTIEFMGIMLVPFAVSILLVTLCCLFLPKEALSLSSGEVKKLPKSRTAVYIVLFFVAIATVFNIIPYVICTAVILAALAFLDRDALKKVDYPLLLTFVAFFIFAGNMSRIGVVETVLSFLLSKGTLVFSALSCQVISNVPSAILLSQFTDNYPALLVGVNIGGTGTLIASLASLITFREYTKNHPGKTARYVLLFTIMNFAFLAVLMAVALLLGYR